MSRIEEETPRTDAGGGRYFKIPVVQLHSSRPLAAAGIAPPVRVSSYLKERIEKQQLAAPMYPAARPTRVAAYAPLYESAPRPSKRAKEFLPEQQSLPPLRPAREEEKNKKARDVVSISPREFDALARIAWYEGLRGYHRRHGLQPGINVAVSILNKRVAGMHPGLSKANPDYANKDIVKLINQPRRYEPVWRYGHGNVFNLQLGKSDRKIAEAAVREAIVNLGAHYHNGTLFQQTSVTNRRGTSFIRPGEKVFRDGVGHEYSRSYKGGARTVTPPFRISEQTLMRLGANPRMAQAAVPNGYKGGGPQKRMITPSSVA